MMRRPPRNARLFKILWLHAAGRKPCRTVQFNTYAMALRVSCCASFLTWQQPCVGVPVTSAQWILLLQLALYGLLTSGLPKQKVGHRYVAILTER